MDALVRLLGYGGLRWGEAVALDWDNVDTTRRRIHVNVSATETSGRLEWGTQKTHEMRTVIVPGFVIEGLGSPRDGLVFTAPKGGPLRHSNFIRDVRAPACEASETPEGLLIQRMLGHASVATTLDTYGSLFTEVSKTSPTGWNLDMGLAPKETTLFASLVEADQDQVSSVYRLLAGAVPCWNGARGASA